jgi:hypothetical protein
MTISTDISRKPALERFFNAFSNLRRAPGEEWGPATLNAAPHKPLLLLALFDAFEEKPERPGTIDRDSLRESFQRYSRALRPGYRFDLAVPFEALANEPSSFWKLHQEGENVRAELDAELVDLLRDKEARGQLREATLSGNFSKEASGTLNFGRSSVLRDLLEKIMTEYREARNGPITGTPLRSVFKAAADELANLPSVKSRANLKTQPSIGQGNWARVPWIMVNDIRETTTAQRGHYIVFLFREDMTGVYLTFNQGVTEGGDQVRAEAIARQTEFPQLSTSFRTDDGIDLRTEGNLASKYEKSTIAYKLYERGEVPDDASIDSDLSLLIDVYERYVERKLASDSHTAQMVSVPASSHSAFQWSDAAGRLIQQIRQSGFYFEPWQIATYLTALRTKPFVILAGVSGTGKSKLPALVANLTGGDSETIPVRPDWTDSSDVLGFNNLEGRFQPGRLLQRCKKAESDPDTHHVAIIDEMNLARVEQYLAEVLSRIEERRRDDNGRLCTQSLVSHALGESDAGWGIGLPANLAIVGTVNMDESSHGFSRKVLDRAFTIELSDVDLKKWHPAAGSTPSEPWPVFAWEPRAIRLPELLLASDEEEALVQKAITALTNINDYLSEAQLQVGYRTRDEVALFLIHAQELSEHFRREDGSPVDPLDIAILMKVLPRLIGGSTPVRRAVLGLFGWATERDAFLDEDQAAEALDHWRNEGRGGYLTGAAYPQTAARLALMWERFSSEGFTSFWL